MNIENKKSQKLVKYEEALRLMEERLLQIDQKKCLSPPVMTACEAYVWISGTTKVFEVMTYISKT